MNHWFREGATCRRTAQSLIRDALSKPVAHSESLAHSVSPALVFISGKNVIKMSVHPNKKLRGMLTSMELIGNFNVIYNKNLFYIMESSIICSRHII